MAWTKDQGAIGPETSTAAAVTSLEHTTNQTIAANTWIFVSAGTSGSTITGLSGGSLAWEKIGEKLEGVERMAVWAAWCAAGLASGAVLTATFGSGGDDRWVQGCSWLGGTARSVISAATSGGGAGTTYSISLSAEHAEDLMLIFAGQENGSAGSSPNGESTEVWDNASGGLPASWSCNSRIATATGAVAIGGTWSAAGTNWAGVAFTITAKPVRVQSVMAAGTWGKQDEGNTRTMEVAVKKGDVIVVRQGAEAANTSSGAPDPAVSGGGLTWNKELEYPGAANANRSMQTVWTATATEDATFTITMTYTKWSTGVGFNARATVWRNCELGKVASNNNAEGSNTPAEVSITTEAANSALDCGDFDWQAATAAETWATINGVAGTKVDSYHGGGDYSALTGYYLDAGTAGSKTVSVSEGGESQRYTINAVELKPYVEAPPETPQELVPDEDLEATGWT